MASEKDEKLGTSVSFWRKEMERDIKTVGNTFLEIEESVKMEWKIENVWSLLNSKEVYGSEVFVLNKSSFKLILEPGKSDEFWSIFIKRESGLKPLYVSATISVQLADNSLREIFEELYMEFNQLNKMAGKYNSLSREEMLENESFTPNNCLKIVLHLTKHQVESEKENDALGANLLQLLISKKFADVRLIVKDEGFECHKAVLAARSSTLESIFEFAPNLFNIELNFDCSASTFKLFLRSLYSGKVEVNEENVFQLLKCAEYYQVPDMVQECLYFMKGNINFKTACSALRVALHIKDTEFEDNVIDFITHNFEIVALENDWLNFLNDYPEVANNIITKAFEDSKHAE